MIPTLWESSNAKANETDFSFEWSFAFHFPPTGEGRSCFSPTVCTTIHPAILLSHSSAFTPRREEDHQRQMNEQIGIDRIFCPDTRGILFFFAVLECPSTHLPLTDRAFNPGLKNEQNVGVSKLAGHTGYRRDERVSVGIKLLW